MFEGTFFLARLDFLGRFDCRHKNPFLMWLDSVGSLHKRYVRGIIPVVVAEYTQETPEYMDTFCLGAGILPAPIGDSPVGVGEEFIDGITFIAHQRQER